ncbi:hypothetical protein Tco_0117951 [Tanacetum coccineum]
MSPSLAIGFKKPIDMLGGFSWLARIKQGMLERLRNTGFNESGEYKKTFISSSVGTSSMKVLHGFKFEVEPLRDHTFEVEPQENVDQGAGLQEVQTQDLMEYQLACDREQHLACELFGNREDSNEAAFTVAAVEKIYAHKLRSGLPRVCWLKQGKCTWFGDHQGSEWYYSEGVTVQDSQRKVGTNFVRRALHTVIGG